VWIPCCLQENNAHGCKFQLPHSCGTGQVLSYLVSRESGHCPNLSNLAKTGQKLPKLPKTIPPPPSQHDSKSVVSTGQNLKPIISAVTQEGMQGKSGLPVLAVTEPIHYIFYRLVKKSLQTCELAPKLVRQAKDRRRNQSMKKRQPNSPTPAEQTWLWSPLQGTVQQGSAVCSFLEAFWNAPLRCGGASLHRWKAYLGWFRKSPYQKKKCTSNFCFQELIL